MEYNPSQHIVYTHAVRCRWPDPYAIDSVAIAPIAPELMEQRQVRATFYVNGLPYPAQRTTELSSYHRPIFVARIAALSPAQYANTTVFVTYEAQLYSRFLRPGPSTNPPPVLNAHERAASLSDPPTFGCRSPAFTAWLDQNSLRRKPGETAITFGRRACDFLVDQMTSPSAAGEPVPTWDEPLDVVCRNLSGDCGRHARMFTGIMRANGIPARCLVGFWVDTKKGMRREGNHVRTEFFADGVGWVPVDTQWAKADALGVDLGNFMVYHVYAEEAMSLPLPNGVAHDVGCLMGFYFRSLTNPAINPVIDGWNVAVPAKPLSVSQANRAL